MSTEKKPNKQRRKIHVNYLARVEGEGALDVKVNNGTVSSVLLNIFEPPRFFEGFLQGREYTEAPDITARICGICPIAYQMSSCHAMEDAIGVKVTGPLRDLRRLIYCGEWIESHVLHVYMLHAPDFLGYEDAIQMAKDFPDAVKKGLALKKAGNDLVSLLAGREIHPINVRVGGFYRVPTKKELHDFRPRLEAALEWAKETVRWAATLPFPDFEQDYEFVALRHESEYPFNEGRLVSSRGLDIPISDFLEHFEEQHVSHSTALHCIHREHGNYFVGPMARYSLNFDRLSPLAQEEARASGLGDACRNPFKSILVRSVEVLWAIEEAIRIIDSYEMPDQPAVPVDPTSGIGHGCTEAPRGILYHRYEVDDNGLIQHARIIPPTSQNQKTIEEDLRAMIPDLLHLPNQKLQHQCEQAIRNYDPCISCSTHFLKLNLEKDGVSQETQ